MRTIRRMMASAVVWLMFAVCAIAANYYPYANFRIYCEPVSMPYSGVVTVPLLLDNPQGYGDMRRAFQVDVTLPVGYEFVANNGSYSVPMAGCKIHEHLFNFDGAKKLRLLFTADEVVPATLGRQICTLTFKQTDRTLKQSSTISFTNFIYVRAASTSGHYGAEQTVTLNPYVPATVVSLNNTSLEMYANESNQLNAILTPANSTSSIAWTTSASSVAMVDQTGLVTAKGIGTATVTAMTTDGTNLSAVCNVTVKGASSITLSKKSISMYAGESTSLNATVSPSRASSQLLNWKTGNPNIATVNANGVITAVGVGTTTITATTTDGTNLSATCTIEVFGATSIKLDKTDVVLFVDESTKLNATVSPLRAAGASLSWSSSSNSVATVDNEGNIKAIGIGTSTITVATTDGTGLSAKCAVTVTPAYTLLVDTLTHVRGIPRMARTINISLANRNAISAMQFDLTLPSYMTMASNDGYPDIWLDADRKARNHSVDISKTSSSYQQYRVIVSSPTNKTFSGNGGAVLHFNVLINQYPGSTGNYAIELSNIVLSEADETQHTISKVTGNVKYGYLVGDANADVKVDVSDYVLTANKILQRSVSDFWSDAANAAYGDNTINVTDLVAITNIALDIREKEIRPAPAVRTIDGEVPLSIAIAEQEATTGSAAVGLSLSNKMALAALQADVTLPEGMSLVEAKSTGRAERYAVESAMLPDGRVRLVLSQFGNAAIAAGEGDIIMLTLAGKATGDATMRVDNITAAERNLSTHYVEGITAQLVGITDVADVTTMQPHIYIEDGAVAIDSPVAGMATVATIDGRNMTIEVQAGHNVYYMPGHGVYIIYLNGVVAKLAL